VVRRFVALESSLRSLAIYPVALLVFSSVVLSVIFWKVYPTFHALTGAVRERPGLLHLAVVAGLSWIGRWADVLLLGLALIAFLLWLLRRNEKGRELTDPLLFLLPGYRAVVLWRGRVTTLEILAAWLSSGAPLDEAVRQAALVQSNARLRTPLLALAGRLAAGGQFGPEGGAPIVDRRTSWAIEAALRSREPAEGCRRLALRERESFDRRLGRTLAWLEPALVLSIGILLGIAIVGTYQPLFETALKVVKE
jgi:type IV pilus assembly protein PilC